MAAYATRTQLYQHGARAASFVGITEADQDAALEAASRTADTYLQAGGYVLPLSSWEVDLTRNVAIMAAFDLLSVRGFRPGDGDNQVIVTRNAEALRWLERVAARSVRPQILDARASTKGTPTNGRPRVLSDDSRGWRSTGLFGGRS